MSNLPPGLDRRILALALPSLGALVAEPAFVLADSVIVGRLGTAPLAGLTVASTLLMTVVGLCIFLAYATTANVARSWVVATHARACRRRRRQWARARSRPALAALVRAGAPWIAHVLGAGRRRHDEYLRWSALLRDARRSWRPARRGVGPPTGLAVARPALPSTLAQRHSSTAAHGSQARARHRAQPTGMGLALALVLARGARRRGRICDLSAAGVTRVCTLGSAAVRRIALAKPRDPLTVAVAPCSVRSTRRAPGRTVAAALVLDALAIAAQVIVGQAVGRLRLARGFLRRCCGGECCGVSLGAVVGASSWWLAAAF